MNSMRLKIPFLLTGLVVLAAACSGAADPTNTPAPVAQPTEAASAPSATPLPPTAIDFEGLHESITGAGLPRLGYDNAPVTVALYLALDDLASAQFAASSLPALVDRARGAEVLITTLPLLRNSGSTDARGAARAALCAAEQNAFYPYFAQLMAWYMEYGDAAYPGSRLVDGIGALGIDQNAWNQCMTSGRPDLALDEAARLHAALPYEGEIPLVTIDSQRSLLDPESLNFTIDRAVAAFNEDLNRALSEATPEVTEVVINIDPLTGEGASPPFDITLPEGWRVAYDTLLVSDLDATRTIPVALYTGPITGGTGTIVLLWAFPNVVATTGAATLTTDLWLDGLRLLRLAVIEEGCNIGTDLRRDYGIGGLAAVGTSFAAVDCPQTPDTRGWFAGLNQFGLNYAFFMYADPIEAMDTGEGELQAILDSIRFQNIPMASPTPEATVEASS